MMVILSRYAVTRAHKKRFHESGTHGPKGASLGIRNLIPSYRQAAHHSVMELHSLQQSVMGGIGLKKRHRSARSLATFLASQSVQC
jgi:hypothetical protein